MSNEPKWYSGTNEENFTSGPCDTREQAIQELNGEAGYVIHASMQQIKFSAESLIDAQYFESDNWFGCDGPDPDRSGECEKADEELQALLDAWTDKWGATFLAPTIFATGPSAEFIEGNTYP